MDFAQEAILLPAQRGGLRVEELLGDAPVELVHVHYPYAGFDLVLTEACFHLRGRQEDAAFR